MTLQMCLFEVDNKKPHSLVSEWGTFKDSLKAPVHSWFTYPAGFSYKAVEHSLKEENIKPCLDTVYDPFMGSGTTNIVARTMGIHSIGIEAHPFVYAVTKSKMNWDIPFGEVQTSLEHIQNQIHTISHPNDLNGYLSIHFPELILKCLPRQKNLWVKFGSGKCPSV